MHWSAGLDMNLDDCPEKLQPCNDNLDSSLSSCTMELPYVISAHEASLLFCWFKDATDQDPRAILVFPPSLEKSTRAFLHREAQQCGLCSESQGVGNGRHLTIESAASEAGVGKGRHLTIKSAASEAVAARVESIGHGSKTEEGTRSGSHRALKKDGDNSRWHRSRDLSSPIHPSSGLGSSTSRSSESILLADQLWELCQKERGRYEEYSRNELREIAASICTNPGNNRSTTSSGSARDGAGDVPKMLKQDVASQLPEDLQLLWIKRQRGLELIRLIQKGDQNGALNIIKSYPESAWERGHGADGPYPMHLACFHGLSDVVEALVALPGVIEQRDGLYNTSLQVAKQAKQQDVIDILMRSDARESRYGARP
eukprot:gene20799-27632_t